jgi:hypothetical protein
MADISTDQLNAISQLLATQQQSDNANQKLTEEISSLGSLVDQERQKSSNDAEIASAISKYKRILGDIDKTSGILNRNEAPMGFFESLVRGAESGPNPLSNTQRLDYLNQLKSLQEQKDIAAQNLKAYLPKEPEKARPASELQVPQQAPAAPQPAQAAGKTEDGIPVVKAERLTPFDEFNIMNQRRQQFIEDSMNDIASLPRGLRDRGMKLVKELADQSFKLPDNIARPVIDAATGQVVPGYAIINGKFEKVEGKPKLEEKNLTAEQSAALQFGTAMADSSKRLASLMEGEGYNPANLTAQLPVPDILKGQNRRRYQGIVTDFALALNRKTSGAAVSEQEYERVEKLFFPQPGDTPAVVRDKAERRQREINTILSNVPDFAKQKLETFQSQQQQQGGQGGGPVRMRFSTTGQKIQ